MTSRPARHAAIRRLLDNHFVTSQGELRELLQGAGYSVTQATLSRDLELLSAVKVPSSVGRAHYAVPDPASGYLESRDPARLARTLADMVESMDYSGNMVVIRTPVGAASYIARAIDRSGLDSVLGTVAGDDTVFVVTRAVDGGRSVCRELKGLTST